MYITKMHQNEHYALPWFWVLDEKGLESLLVLEYAFLSFFLLALPTNLLLKKKIKIESKLKKYAQV